MAAEVATLPADYIGLSTTLPGSAVSQLVKSAGRIIGQYGHQGKIRHRNKITGEDPVSRAVLIHQTQDQGIEAARPGAGRDDYDQHKSIKRLR